MPRNVVTVSRRSFPPLPRYRRERDRILTEVSKRHPPTPHTHGKWLTLDFSKREEPSLARAKVIRWLDEISPDWQRYVKVYPLRSTRAGNVFWMFGPSAFGWSELLRSSPWSRTRSAGLSDQASLANTGAGNAAFARGHLVRVR